jgi:hypothetical protein
MKVTCLSSAADGGTCFGAIDIRVDDPVTDSSGNTVTRSRVFPAVGTMYGNCRRPLIKLTTLRGDSSCS